MIRFLLLALLPFSLSAEPITNVYKSENVYCACVTVPNLPGGTESLELAADVTYCSISGMMSPNDVGLGETVIRSKALPARIVAGITSQKLCGHLFLLVPL